ncbi:MAG: YbhB/YbcL family Raf kinase inhibitor-like protein [Steroidobacteraceae bacterium]
MSVRLRFCILSAALAAVSLALGAGAATPGPRGADVMTLSSPDFQSRGPIPARYTLNLFGCHGSNRSPALRWSGAPAGTKSFVLTLFDLDERGTPSGWWHWVVYDIPPTMTALAPDAGAAGGGGLPHGASLGRVDTGHVSYDGPCPDPGTGAHRYLFTLYALKVGKLPVPENASGAMVSYTVRDYTLAKATLIGLYETK